MEGVPGARLNGHVATRARGHEPAARTVRRTALAWLPARLALIGLGRHGESTRAAEQPAQLEARHGACCTESMFATRASFSLQFVWLICATVATSARAEGTQPPTRAFPPVPEDIESTPPATRATTPRLCFGLGKLLNHDAGSCTGDEVPGDPTCSGADNALFFLGLALGGAV